jgi:hypothetical protein
MNDKLEGKCVAAGGLMWSNCVDINTTMENLIRDSGTEGRDLEAGPPEYQVTVLLPS